MEDRGLTITAYFSIAVTIVAGAVIVAASPDRRMLPSAILWTIGIVVALLAHRRGW